MRETVTGPLVDTLFAGVGAVEVELTDGTVPAIPYRSRIARDLASRVSGGLPHGFNCFATEDAGLLEDGSVRIVAGVSPKYPVHRDPALHAPCR